MNPVLAGEGKKLEVHHPLEQGLKQKAVHDAIVSEGRARSTPSIRTRIETKLQTSRQSLPGPSRSTPSIRTRIETSAGQKRRLKCQTLEVHHPLEQGLKRNADLTGADLNGLEVHHPLEQGLKQNIAFFSTSETIARSTPSIRTRIETFFDQQQQELCKSSKYTIH